jgi:glutamate racemase
MSDSGSETPMPARAAIGVFDSGVGGLSVLRHLRAQLPREDFYYFSDAGYAPYGEKPEALIIERTLVIAAYLRERGVKALVVACNTATATSIDALRLAYPDLPVVGVEPGLKPAAALSRSRTVGVLATESTLASGKFARLREQVEADTGARFVAQACNGLADRIEAGELRSPATALLLRRYIDPLLAEGADTLVLGCTHYPFVQPLIETIVPAETRIVDTGAAVALQLGRLLTLHSLRQPGTTDGSLELFTSGSCSALAGACLHLLQIHLPVVRVTSPTP